MCLDCSQVNSYSLIGENDVHTEGALRARFEKAASCSPCMLVLRHIDALSQTTQGTETGKGNYYCSMHLLNSQLSLLANVLADAISTWIRELPQAWRMSVYPVLVLATTDNPEQTAPQLLSCFKHEIDFEVRLS